MRKLFITFILVFFYNYITAQKYTDTYLKDANKVGLEWWSNVNSGKYKASYNMLSDILKTHATLDDWLYQIKMLMEEYGNFEKRIVKESYFHSKLDGFEDGFYVTIEYEVEYSKTKNHTEFLLLKQSDEFKWEVLDFNYTFQNNQESILMQQDSL